MDKIEEVILTMLAVFYMIAVRSLPYVVAAVLLGLILR